jgi:anti-anti-sigma factor
MTAVSAARGTGVRLICDVCGASAPAEGGGLHDADLVYVAVASIGWSGAPFARGPHRCPRCSSGAAPVVRQRAHRGTCPEAAERVSVTLERSVALVRVIGDLDVVVADELRGALERAALARPTVIVDLTAAHTIDPAGLGALVRARNAARRRQGELVLAGPSRFVQTVLRTMRLHTAFRVFRSPGEALAAAEPSHSAGRAARAGPGRPPRR